MLKRLVFLAFVLMMVLMPSAHAATIIWVSDSYDDNADGAPDDQPWIDMLEANGYTVDLSFRNQQARTLDDDKIAALNAGDLIIVSRNSNSGDYDDGNEISQWNSLTAPIILQAMHFARNNRWRWVDTTTLPNLSGSSIDIVAAGHPIFAGVTNGAQLLDPDVGPSTFVGSADMGNGTLLAQVKGDGATWIAEWETSVEYYPGSGQFAGGPRMIFCSGTQETSPTIGRGQYNLTPDGEILFLNAVRYMLGGGREKASNPNPADGALYPDTWLTLSWSAGDFAASHDVYISDNYDAVSNGTADAFVGNQAATTLIIGFPGFPYPEGLVPGTTYYWRVDEVNEAEPNSPWTGDVWSFMIPPRTAYNPDPADGAEFVDPASTFSWTGGFGAKLHTVYMGTDFDTVSNATGGMMQGTTTYRPAAPLALEKVYYWRVDEFDAVTTHKGNVWAFTTPGAAGAPQPGNGAVGVGMTQKLAWTAAATAASHDVYFGTDMDAVVNATTASPEYKGNRAKGAESYDPGKLDWNGTYYWRVDAVYSTGKVKGLVWSFTTADFLSVDDFESYNDIEPPDPASNRIFDNWIDGFGTTNNGALVGNDLPPYAEQTVVHGGIQSMIYRYDNNLKTSEATLTLTSGRNWTEEGVTKLSLWFRGAPVNSAEKMYVALNGNAVVYHDNAAATQTARWTEWVIDLQAFANQGVNLVNINTITIGFGTKNNPAAGGTGKMYFDDIRLIK